MLTNQHKLDQNVCGRKISDKFDYGSDQIRSTVRLIYSWIRKNIFDFVYNTTSANINQSATNVVTTYMTIRSRKILIMGLNRGEHHSYLLLNKEHLLNSTLFTL